MATELHAYGSSIFEFYVAAPWDLVLLIASLFLLHRAIYQINIIQYARDTLVALFIHHHLIINMRVNLLAATILTLAFLPVMQILLEITVDRFVKSEERRAMIEPIVSTQFLKKEV